MTVNAPKQTKPSVAYECYSPGILTNKQSLRLTFQGDLFQTSTEFAITAIPSKSFDVKLPSPRDIVFNIIIPW